MLPGKEKTIPVAYGIFESQISFSYCTAGTGPCDAVCETSGSRTRTHNPFDTIVRVECMVQIEVYNLE